jgi:NitT/TauT family transport system permease protein
LSIKKLLLPRPKEEEAPSLQVLPEEIIRNLKRQRALAAQKERRRTVTQLISVMGAVLVWWILADTIMPNLPNPAEWLFGDRETGAPGAVVTVQDPWFYESIYWSVARVYLGFAIGVGVGVPMGLMMGWNRIANDFGFPIFELIRPIPPVAWVPLSIIITGAITPAIIFITFLGSWYVVTLNSVLGAESVDPSVLRAAKCLGAKPRQIFRHIILPGSLPAIFTGMVLGMAMSWITVVAGEMIAGDYGIGYMAWQAYTLIRYSDVITAMLTIGALGYASSILIRALSNRYLRWRKVYG